MVREALTGRCRFASECRGFGSSSACHEAGSYYSEGGKAGCYRHGGLKKVNKLQLEELLIYSQDLIISGDLKKNE